MTPRPVTCRRTRPVGWPVCRGPAAADETGSQSLEFAMVVPLVAVLVMALVAAGGVAVAAVRTQVVAGQLARAAAVSHDRDVHRLADASLTLVIDPPSGARVVGDLVTVEVRHDLRIGWMDLPLRATATATTESVP